MAKSKTGSKSKSSSKPKTPASKRVSFGLRTNPGSCAYVSGSFNNWDGEAKVMKDADGDGDFAVSLLLPKGQHEYKFVINGEWQVDPDCPDWVVNEYGTLNSVINVG